jgi:pimeloyl-ACP methyl ester carboxylesterase
MKDYASYVRDGAIEVIDGDNPRHNDKAFVFFSGRQFNRGMFHFGVTAVKLGRPYLCVRDAGNQWYRGRNYPATLHHIWDWMYGRDRVVFVGSSMGGSAALKYGLELLPDKVIAFAPQNFVEPLGVDLVADYKTNWPIPETHIHYCRRSPESLDVAIAEQMSGISKVHLHGRDCDSHRVMDLMDASGEMLALLEGA